LAALAMAAAVSASDPVSYPPKAVPTLYVTPNYDLTFRPPKGTWYCPLPDHWTGSDHGTVLFLARPAKCYGAGFPSSSRGFDPPGLPRIDVYYGYDTSEDDDPAPTCHEVGTLKLMGKSSPICRESDGGLSARSTYSADSAAEVIISLYTTRERLEGDLATLRTLSATVKPCRSTWNERGQRRTYGEGEPCPNGKWF
jgi:hypothetical protein